MFSKAGDILQHRCNVSEQREQASTAKCTGEQNQQHLRIHQPPYLFAEIGGLLLDDYGDKPDDAE
ncbi:hypothetical protein D3C81_1777090 [compost metagenome]